MRRLNRFAAVLTLLITSCDGEITRDADVDADRDIEHDTGSDGDADTDVDADSDSDFGVDADVDEHSITVTTELITSEHRFVPDAMFGGWGPHLGHLVRVERESAGSDLYWSDDLCSQEVTGDCDVAVNRRVGIMRRDVGAWTTVATVVLPTGVQQNTATLATGETLRVFGVDTAASRIVECLVDVHGGTSDCSQIPIEIGPSANYIGAALSPLGPRFVWWTNVADGGGGSFSYIVEYTLGWNGPRSGPVGGYNDCAYAHAAFRTDGSGMTFFCQVITGWAPSWSFSTLVGDAVGSDVPISWTNALAAADGDPVMSTNDLWLDGTTQDTHLIARTEGGAAAYYFRPRDGTWTGALFVEPASYRARWIATNDLVALVSGPASGGLRLRQVPRSTVVAGTPLELDMAPVYDIVLPDGFGRVIAIYPLAATYQSVEVTSVELVVVGETRQNEALFVEVEL